MAETDKDVLARMLGALQRNEDILRPLERNKDILGALQRNEDALSEVSSREPAGTTQEQTPTIVRKYGGAPAKEAQSLISEAMSITRNAGIKGSENLKKVEQTLSESLEGKQPDPETASDARSFFESRINKLNQDKATKLLDMDQKLEVGLEQLRQTPKSDMSMGELLGRSLFALAPLLARAGGEYAGELGGKASVKMAEDFAKDVQDEAKRQKELEGQKVKLGYERGKKEVEEMDALLKKLQEGEIDLELLPLKQRYLLQELALRSGATMAGRQDETADTLLKGAGLMAKLAELQALRPREGAGEKLTKGQETLDRLFAKQYDEFISGGGATQAYRDIGQLQKSLSELSKTDIATGPIVASMPNFMRQKGIKLMEDIRQTATPLMRLALGAQFTEKEGERILSQTFNPELEENVNVERGLRLLTQLKRATALREKQAQYFEENGTIKGFPGLSELKNVVSEITGAGEAEKIDTELKEPTIATKAPKADVRAQRLEAIAKRKEELKKKIESARKGK